MVVRLNQGVGETYRRLGENGKSEKVARIAAARKLLLIAHAVYRTGRPYRTSEGSGGGLTFNTASDPAFYCNLHRLWERSYKLGGRHEQHACDIWGQEVKVVKAGAGAKGRRLPLKGIPVQKGLS